MTWIVELTMWLMDFLIGAIPSTLPSLLGLSRRDD